MTGTAETEAAEFEKIYKLDIVVIPTNKPMRRLENPDVVYRTEKEKYKAVADEIAKLHEKKQPVLVGTTSIEKSERLSQILQRKGVRHVVLNAKFHEREAEIVAQAGRLGMVTICHEHGRARHGYSAGRQSGVHGAAGAGEEGPGAGHQRGRGQRSIPWRRRDSCASTTRGRSLKSPRRIGRRRFQGARGDGAPGSRAGD
jgi:hypothetical protein